MNLTDGRRLWLNWVDEHRMRVWTDLVLYKSDEGTEILRRLDVIAKRIVGG